MYRPKSLAAFILAFFSFSSWSSDFCNTGKLLTKVNYLESESNDVVLSADKSYLNKGSSFFLEGNAEVVAKDYYFSANKIEFNKDKNNFSGNGNIKFQNSFFSSIGDSLSFDDDDISAKNVYFSFNDSKSNGKAKEITASKNLKTLSEASFTNCPIENNDWVIEAQKITIDDLAVMVQNGFNETNEKMEKGFNEVNIRLDRIENTLLKNHEERIKRLESALVMRP